MLCDQKNLQSSKQGKDNMSKLRRVQALGQVLCGPTLQIQVFMTCCILVRDTKAVAWSCCSHGKHCFPTSGAYP